MQNLHRAAVSDTVPDLLAAASGLEKSGTFHVVEVLGARALGIAEVAHQFMHRRGAAAFETADDPQAVRMCQEAHYRGQPG